MSISEEYEFYGFKLYEYTEIITRMDRVERTNEYNVIVQYKAGEVINTWQQERLLNKDDEEVERWWKQSIPVWCDSYKFIRNMTEEEMFTILL